MLNEPLVENEIAAALEIVTATAADPTFTTNPAGAISYASTQAAEHFRQGRWLRARVWVRVSLALSGLAGREPGAVVRGLTKTLSVPSS